ncbi:MAG: hypothetical protein IKG01_13885 [Lachnospiraceae bacterium]|nr:hypothetical protein [Lachnospiraceae bacterium]
MIFTRKPYQIDSVYYEDNTLNIGCKCLEYKESITGGKGSFNETRGRTTISVFSPGNKIITVRVTNHQAEPRAKASSVISQIPSNTGTLEDMGDTLVFKSGYLEAHINKTTFSIKFIYCNNELCRQNANMPVFYKTDSGSDNCYSISKNVKTGASFELGAKEIIYGLGGNGSSIVRNGQAVKCNCAGYRSYSEGIPFILSDAKYGLFVNSTRPVEFDTGSVSGSLSFEADGEEIEYSIIAGDTLVEVLEIFSKLNGRIPAIPYTSGGISLALNDDLTLTAQGIIDSLKAARASGVAVNEIWIGNSWHPSYAPYGFTWDTVRFPEPDGFARAVSDMGISLGISVNPFVSVNTPEYAELLDAGLLVSFPDGTAVVCDTGSDGIALIDLNIPDARSWFINACTKLAKNGYTVFESDYTSCIADAFEKAAGKKGYLSNFTSVLNSALSDLSARERGRFGSLTISDSTASGDQESPFSNIYCSLSPDFSDLTATVKKSISLGMTGFGGINIDIPEKDLTDSKLLDRWIGFAAFAPHARFTGSLKLLEDMRMMDSVKAFSAIRSGLAPYIFSSLCEFVNYGTPVIRAMALEFAGDPAAAAFDSEYMFGPSLLAAPVTTPNDSIRIYIPAGIWTDFMTHEKVQGPRYITRKVTPNSVPVYVRPNSIIPTRTPDTNSGIGSLDNLTFTCFGLGNGTTAACEVFADGGQGSGIFTAEVAGNKIIIRTKNLGGTKHLVLSGIFNVVGLSESVPEKMSYGTSIEFSSSELVISLG